MWGVGWRQRGLAGSKGVLQFWQHFVGWGGWGAVDTSSGDEPAVIVGGRGWAAAARAAAAVRRLLSRRTIKISY